VVVCALMAVTLEPDPCLTKASAAALEQAEPTGSMLTSGDVIALDLGLPTESEAGAVRTAVVVTAMRTSRIAGHDPSRRDTAYAVGAPTTGAARATFAIAAIDCFAPASPPRS
jgi:hypothetical protein